MFLKKVNGNNIKCHDLLFLFMDNSRHHYNCKVPDKSLFRLCLKSIKNKLLKMTNQIFKYVQKQILEESQLRSSKILNLLSII